ncbi:TonB-linked outer membrane protein, SusC/RagA family [Pedobacter suwonensis]|uniref:TonB-linked outer membrane protein, SusC/RagA family n=1 Tax=Pedobacter suwonensis TaxID=332999 RepID=A0A1I0TKZ8_9SPHI|nr:SusC/RagA family TonB-linked outer membrane protein [Pedobacter suwonensis]SFA52470.1 TonB-linked outer membrane protein, SusC/RagA family [Pedobacter suwonensis]
MKKMYLRCLSILLLCFITISAFAQKNVTGTVKDASGPLPGVSVSIKGTSKVTQTDASGKFSINVQQNDILVFTAVGFRRNEVTVNGQNSFSITLIEDANALSEVVVTALGVKREAKSLGYAVSTISSKEITQAGATNFASAMYGKAPGVRIASAPGGATSGVNINIRGVNSITNKTQPLIVLDGVPIRDGEYANNDYWGDQRMRGNGLLDINNEDIESISILKGASAAALYGSEAVNGVVLITTKSGKGAKGFSVDFNANYTHDKVAYLPRYQNVRGPGIDPFYSNAGQAADGFIYQDLDGNGSKETRGVGAFSINFGPLFDGKPTLTWDGQIRPYEAQIDNYAKFFQTANNSNVNVAISNTTDNSNIRLSLTRQDNQGVSYGTKNEKNIANLNTSFKLGKRFTTDLIVNYINQYTHNRPFMVDRMINNFTGMIGRFDNPEWYNARYKTSRGYKFVTGTNQSLTPSENIIYPGFKADVADYIWNVRENNENEFSDRIIGSLTNTLSITDNLKLRARVSSDITSQKTETSKPNEVPIAFNPNSGFFGLMNYNSKILYGDALLTYSKKITKDIGITAMGGYTATRETYNSVQRETNGGLSVENWYDLSASNNMATFNNGLNYRRTLVKDALLGTLNASFRDYLFVEGTVRRDRTSTMNPNENSFVYPSVNSGFVFSEAFKLPEAISYGKLRASWGIVGNYPSIYLANVAYTQNTLGTQGGSNSVLYTTIPTSFGNELIKPERKKELEFGLEMRFLKDRLRLDMSYYNAQINDQILPLTIPSSSGATSILANVGTLRNKGLEVALSATPIRTTNFSWNSTINFSNNKNVVEKLANGATELIHADYDGNAAQLKSIVGQPMGDIYVHPIARDANGNAIINSDGLYKIDANNMIKAGNAMPKVIGGFINSFAYKNFSMDIVMDFRYGGHVMPTGINWMISRGLLKESLNYMDTESGGLTYYRNAAGIGIQTTGTQGPNGEKVYHDGMLMQGVLENGQANTNVISQSYYYWNTYNWGGPQYSSSRYELYVIKNNYIKMREITFGYKIPVTVAKKIGAKNLQVSAFGRNLFYLYRTIKDLDPEQLTSGSRWTQTITNAGSNPATRTFGFMVRAGF